MDGNSSKASSSLVLADQNAHKPGGCVAIFCKLFDWNKRFAKKKLLPKKLLASAPGNKVSKKFNANENLLKKKHLLADNAKGGGIHKKNTTLVKHEMKSASLVARLMGLDSMPVGKPQNADKSPLGKQKVANLGKGRSRNGFQQHKTQNSDNRFGAEVLQLRNVISRSKKHHHKLASPVKSPKNSKTSSRLIDAATRILEPGLQATSRAKCALTYSNSIPQQTTNDVIDLPSQSCCILKNSCQSCGHVLGGQDFTNSATEQNPADVVLLRSRNQAEDLTQTMFEGMPVSLNGKKHWDLHESSFVPHRRDGWPYITRDDSAPQLSTMEKVYRRRVSPRNAFNDKKDFIAMSRNDAFSNISRKGMTGFCRHAECSSCSSSLMDRERTLDSKFLVGRRITGNVVNMSKDVSPQRDNIRMNQSNSTNDEISGQRLVKEGDHGVKSASSLLMNEDALGALLVKTLKELASHGENESVQVTPPGRTVTAILQELISALTADRPVLPEVNVPSQAGTQGKRLPVRFSSNRFSPGSVLDASFSNDSCVSSSVDDNSGTVLQPDLMDHSIDDSESSFNNRETGCNALVSPLLDHISAVLDKANLPDIKLSTAYAKDVLLNTELLFGNANGSEPFLDFLVGPFLDELETLSFAAWRDTIIFGFQLSKEGNSSNPIRRFLFDSLVECLGVRYDRYTNCGFVEWCRLPKQLNVDTLVQLFDYEVRKSASMAEITLDEIINWEMNASVPKWTDFVEEVFESGAEIGLIIFQGLVDEIVADFMIS